MSILQIFAAIIGFIISFYFGGKTADAVAAEDSDSMLAYFCLTMAGLLAASNIFV